MATYGMFDEYMAHERIYCLYTLELSETGELVPPDIRMNQFGDSAVVIWDGIEFIRRIKAALIKKYGDSIWFGYRRVAYDVIPTKTQVYTEFSKTEPYSWQNEFRLVVDPVNGRIERNEWERMTDVAKMMYINPGGKVELFEDPGSDLITIGDISDICSIYSIDEFLSISTDIAEKANPYRVEGPENQEHRKKTFLYRPFIKF